MVFLVGMILPQKSSGLGVDHPETCYICGCFRAEGCFAPGVKITMADGSLRKIEDVRAGDMVRNAKTGAPVKVRQVIEGPEALPLIRFGFEGDHGHDQPGSSGADRRGPETGQSIKERRHHF